jgi:hypothetical protein
MDGKVLIEEEFADVHAAQAEVLSHMIDYRDQLGADRVVVRSSRTTYFEIGIPQPCDPTKTSEDPSLIRAVPLMDEASVLARAERVLEMSRNLRERLQRQRKID